MNNSLKQNINNEVKQAMRARQSERLSVLRMLQAAIKQKEIDERVELTDQDIQQIVEKQIKQRKESFNAFQQAGRQEAADKEQYEIKVLTEFQPEQASENEINELINKTVTDLKAQGLTGGQAMGKAMGQLKSTLSGRADMSIVSKKLKEQLNS